MDWTIEKHEDAPNGKMIVTVRVTHNPSWFWRLLGEKPVDEIRQYIGEDCFWKGFPSFETAGSGISLFLGAYYDRVQYEKRYGIASTIKPKGSL